jgi:hypothetical protein
MKGASFHYPRAPHALSKHIATAFAKGARAVGHDWFARQYPDEIADWNTTYGILHGGTDVIRHCEENKKDFWYIDHGYLRRSSSIEARDGYYRVVKNELQHTSFAGVGGAPEVSECGERRLRELGVTLAPRRNPADGEIIVLVPPTDYQWRFYTPHLQRPEEWVRVWKEHCEKKFCRPVVVSRKGDEIPLTKLLDKASYVIGFNSTGLLEAAARGIFVESTGPSPLFWLKSWDDRKTWEATRYAIFCEIAQRQFTLGELATGLAQTVLRNVGEFPG